MANATISKMISGTIVSEFLASTKMEKTQTVKDIMETLARPDNIAAMINASKLGLPALSAVVIELETRFDNRPDFPLHHNGEHANSKQRKNCGWMVKHVLSYFGYAPVRKARIGVKIPTITGGTRDSYFTTSAVYEFKGNEKFKVVTELDAR